MKASREWFILLGENSAVFLKLSSLVFCFYYSHLGHELYGSSDSDFFLFQARLTCPCCNMRKKDAVLTKCFHVFCFECVKTRYDTRQRKCPKCNAAFGANDFHRIYIGWSESRKRSWLGKHLLINHQASTSSLLDSWPTPWLLRLCPGSPLQEIENISEKDLKA